MPVSSNLIEKSALQGLMCNTWGLLSFLSLAIQHRDRHTAEAHWMSDAWVSEQVNERMYKNRIWPNPKSWQIIHARSTLRAAWACDSTLKRNATSWWKCIVCSDAFQKGTTSLAPNQIYDCNEITFPRFQHFIDKTVKVVLNAQIRRLQKHSSPWIPRLECKIWMLFFFMILFTYLT